MQNTLVKIPVVWGRFVGIYKFITWKVKIFIMPSFTVEKIHDSHDYLDCFKDLTVSQSPSSAHTYIPSWLIHSPNPLHIYWSRQPRVFWPLMSLLYPRGDTQSLRMPSYTQEELITLIRAWRMVMCCLFQLAVCWALWWHKHQLSVSPAQISVSNGKAGLE